jgi:hypothetical protein
MANNATPYGFDQWGDGSGGAPTFQQTVGLIAPTDTTAIFTGDPVVLLTTGYITRANPAAIPANGIYGIFGGCEYYSPSQNRIVQTPYWPGTNDVAGDIKAYVINTPFAKFKVKSSAAAITQADVGANVNFVYVGTTGNTFNGQSNAAVDPTTIAVTATLPFRIVEILTIGTDPTQPNNEVVVEMNNQSFRTTTGI